MKMKWDDPEFNPLGLNITNPEPKLKFRAPVDWQARCLLKDRDGKDYVVATALDPIRKVPFLIQAGLGKEEPLRRLFVSTQSGWEIVEDKNAEFVALRIAEDH